MGLVKVVGLENYWTTYGNDGPKVGQKDMVTEPCCLLIRHPYKFIGCSNLTTMGDTVKNSAMRDQR